MRHAATNASVSIARWRADEISGAEAQAASSPMGATLDGLSVYLLRAPVPETIPDNPGIKSLPASDPGLRLVRSG